MSEDVANLMIDIETLGTTPGSAILSVGAMTLTRNFDFVDEMEVFFDLDDAFATGLIADPATVGFWFRNPDALAAQMAVPTRRRVTYRAGLGALSAFMAAGDDVPVWTRGHFDVPILNAALQKVDLPTIPFWLVRDQRTVDALHKAILPEPPIPRGGTRAAERARVRHSALDDCRVQAERMCRIWRDFGGTVAGTEVG